MRGMAEATPTHLFGYGSLVNRTSAEETLGRVVGEMRPATLHGWRRRWSLLRDNPHCEKTFELEDGTVPDWLLTLNVEATGNAADVVNGVLIEIGADDFEALDVREVRYRRVDVTDAIATPPPASLILTYTATHHHTALMTPARALILSTYLEAVEQGFTALGEDELEAFRRSTGAPPVPVVKGRLIRHRARGPSPVHW